VSSLPAPDLPPARVGGVVASGRMGAMRRSIEDFNPAREPWMWRIGAPAKDFDSVATIAAGVGFENADDWGLAIGALVGGPALQGRARAGGGGPPGS